MSARAGWGMARMAEALLHNVGGRAVQLRLPLPAVQGDLGEQVGLAVPQFQNVELVPAVFRKMRARVGVGSSEVKPVQYELLVSAVAVERVVGTMAFDSASLLFAQTAGVLVDDDAYTVTSLVGEQAFGALLLWRVGLQGPAALVL